MKRIYYGMIGGGEGAFIGTVRGMAFIETVVASSRANATWCKLPC